MKNAKFILLTILAIPILGLSQSLENLDYISPFNEDLAAIQKDGQWAFINTKGEIVINFRSDLVTTKRNNQNYPIFNGGRCLIAKQKEGISYFGYIDTLGKTIIEPQFLNASNFSEDKAIALELIKETVARNKALGKDIVYYRYFEVIINTSGIIENYLTQKGVNVVLDKDFLRKPPEITAKRISDNLYAIRQQNKTWAIININD